MYEPQINEPPPQPQGPTVTVPLGWFNEVLEIYYAAKADRLVPQFNNEPEPYEAVMPSHPGGLSVVPGFDIPGSGYTPRGVAAQKMNAATPPTEGDEPHKGVDDGE